MRYVDRFDNDALLCHYPELAGQRLVSVDIIDDGERLTAFASDSEDFIVANHFLEHCQDPIGALKAFVRVLRPGGVVYLAVPDKRYCFDRRRESTSLDHVIRDHEEGPQVSRSSHFEEWARHVDPEIGRQWLDEDAIKARAKDLEQRDYSIHFHNWTASDLLEFFHYVATILPVEIELVANFEHEVVTVLRKRPETGRGEGSEAS